MHDQIISYEVAHRIVFIRVISRLRTGQAMAKTGFEQ